MYRFIIHKMRSLEGVIFNDENNIYLYTKLAVSYESLLVESKEDEAISRLEGVRLNEKEKSLSKLLFDKEKKVSQLQREKIKRQQLVNELSKRYSQLEFRLLDHKVQRKQIVEYSDKKAGSQDKPYNPQKNILYYKKNLSPPVDSDVEYKFGAVVLAGMPKLDGLIYEGRDEQAVRAIFDGKVVFSGWIRGMGMLAIVEHSDDFVSIYGNNDSLLAQEGDVVSAGSEIAISSKEIYFAIRIKGEPVNPHLWIRN